MSTPLESLAREALAALVNGTVQGCLVALLVVLLLSRPRRLNAATRHAALMVTLFVVAALPLLQCGNARLESEAILPVEPLQRGSIEEATTATSERLESPAERAIDAQDGSAPALPVLESPGEPEARSGAPSAAWARLTAWFQNWAPQSWISRWSLGIPARWVFGLLAMGVLVAIALLARLAHQYWQLRALKQSVTEPEATTLALFEEVRRDAAIDRPVRLVLHEDAPVPLALGFAKPAVVLPTELADEAPASELKQILRHEMAHLVRRDDWANLCQQTLRALFFFHPAVWILSRRLTVEREIACDDQVIATASNPRDYALLLCEFAGRQSGHPSVAASAAWSQPSQLKERIHMLLNPDRNASPRLARGRFALLAACSLGVALAGLRAAPRLSLPAPSADAAPSASAVNVGTADENVPTVSSAPVAAPTGSIETHSAPVVSTEAGTIIATAPRAHSLASVAVIASSRPPSEDSAPLHKDALPPVAPVPPAAFPATPALPPTPALDSVHAEISELEAPEPPEPFRGRAVSKPAPVSSREEALERRIQRLEKRVQELAMQNRDLASAGGKRVEKRIEFGQSRPGADLTLREGPEFKPDARHSDPLLGPEFAEKVKRDVEQAMRDQERVMKEVQQEMARAKKEAAESLASRNKVELDSKDAELMKRDFDLEREKLRHERAALDAERRAMDQQIRTLEKQLAKMERDRDRDRDRAKKVDPSESRENANQDSDPLVKPPVPNKP